jgi:hypothetical protein
LLDGIPRAAAGSWGEQEISCAASVPTEKAFEMRISPVTLLPLVFLPSAAEAADLRFPVHSSRASDCADTGLLERIVDRFAWAERTHWHRGFVIETIDDPRPSGHHFAEPGTVHRDYCIADSVMTNGTVHPVYYAIERGLGFAGIGRYVDFCIPDLDPWHVHDGDCRTVR